MFEYFTIFDNEQYIFYQIPRILFTQPEFKRLITDAKMLYGFFLARTELSRKNGWVDEDTFRIYIYFQQKEAAEMLGVGKNTIIKLFAELEDFGLIVRKKQGQGKPVKIYVKNFNTYSDGKDENTKTQNKPLDSQKVNLLTPKNQTSRHLKSKPLESQNLGVSPIEIYRENKKSEIDLSINQENDEIDETQNRKSESELIDEDDYQREVEKVHEQVEYEYLVNHNKQDIAQIDEMVDLITWARLSNQSATKINGEPVSMKLVRKQFDKLDESHIEYVLECVKSNKQKIVKRRGYLLTCLYNAPSTIDGYYENMVERDMYGDDG